MKRVLPAGATGIAMAVAFVAMVSGTAFAYFSTTGAGSASAGVSKLSTPVISSAIPAAGGTVALTWGAVTAPGSGTVTYSVSRDGGEPAGNCPGAEAPAEVTTCTDSGLKIGTHSYTVTATWRSWSATSSTSTAKITIGPADHLVLTAASPTPTAGASDNLTITVKDESNSTVTTYTGSHSLVFSGASASPGGTAPTVVNTSGTAIAFGAATAITFTTGVATVTSSKNGLMKLYRSGATSIKVSDGSIATSSPLEVTVAAAAASKLTLAASSTTPTAGSADELTTTAVDTYGNTVTSYTGSHNLTFSGASASPNGTVPTVSNSSGAAIAFGAATAVTFSAGVASASGAANGVMTLCKSGATSVNVTDGSLSSSTALVATVAAAPAVELVLSASSTTPTAGATINLTTTAKDTYANTATSYAGSHNIIFSGASASPNATLPTVVNSTGTAVAFGTATALTFTAGVAAVTSSKNGLTKLNRAEVANITAGDGSISTPVALVVTVSPGAASKLAFSNVSISAGVLGSPCLFTCTVTGLGNSGTVKAKVNVTDSVGNTVSAIGSGHTVTVTVTAGATITGGTLAYEATGAAESTTQFTYTARSSGAFTDTITAKTTVGTTYTSATFTASK